MRLVLQLKKGAASGTYPNYPESQKQKCFDGKAILQQFTYKATPSDGHESTSETVQNLHFPPTASQRLQKFPCSAKSIDS
jgi:hypothetical protein